MRRVFYLLIGISLTLCSCIKPPSYPDIPHIEFQSVSSNYVTNGNDDTITFTFTDGNGNIGVNSNAVDSACPCLLPGHDSACFKLTSKNIFLIDSRGNQCITPFASANLQPTGKYKGISGNMQVIAVINTTKCYVCNGGSCTPASASNPYGLDTVVYTIFVTDMAGNLSNGIITTPILTGCQ